MSPTQNWPLLILFLTGFWNVRAGRALGVQPAQPLVHRQGQPTRALISSRPSSTLGKPRPRTWGA